MLEVFWGSIGLWILWKEISLMIWTGKGFSMAQIGADITGVLWSDSAFSWTETEASWSGTDFSGF